MNTVRVWGRLYLLSRNVKGRKILLKWKQMEINFENSQEDKETLIQLTLQEHSDMGHFFLKSLETVSKISKVDMRAAPNKLTII